MKEKRILFMKGKVMDIINGNGRENLKDTGMTVDKTHTEYKNGLLIIIMKDIGKMEEWKVME